MANNETLMTMACDVFSGPMKKWAWFGLFFGVIFTGIFIYALVKFITIGEYQARIFWIVPVLLSALFVAMLKLWFWLQMMKNSIIKALKKS